MRPSLLKPIRTHTFMLTRGRLPARNSSSRVLMIFTGRRALRARIAFTTALLSSQDLPPKPPPTAVWITRTSASRTPRAEAMRIRAMNSVWVFM